MTCKVFAAACQALTDHALYMRLKRTCSKTSAGKLQVPEEVHQQWLKGDRESLQLALTRALKIHGFDTTHKTRVAVRVWVCPNMFFSTIPLYVLS